MAKSPCIGCEFELVDKNNPTCRECDRRVEYATSDEKEMNIEHVSRRSIAKPDRMKKMKIEETTGACEECLIKGCGEEVYCRGLCLNHYQQWYKGYIDHPVYGAYTIAQPKKNSIREDKRGQVMGKDKTGSKKPEAEKAKAIKKAALPPLVAVQLSLYPEIHRAVYDTAEKFFVTPEHVIISLLGEALAARTRLRDASSGEERP